jgi:uncharacterized repeat protein (TIGR03803 family)
VTNIPQKTILKMRLGTATAALAFVFVLVLGMIATQPAQAQTFTVLHNFTGSPDGEFPLAGLVRDAAGNLYGTTDQSGNHNKGTVFKLSKTGKESLLHNFTGGHSDGSFPSAGLILDPAGNLYGSTYGGGASNRGTAFKVSQTRNETVLHSFRRGKDGTFPNGLIQDVNGDFYGTTMRGGGTRCSRRAGCGIVFKLSRTGNEIVLHSFTGYRRDGANPEYSSLLLDSTGNLYGVTPGGGSSNYGTVFKVSKTGKETVLYNFAGGTMDGCSPYGTPAMDKNGNLYGTTSACGSSNLGIVWKVSQKGTETVLHNFTGAAIGGATDGGAPYAGVIIDRRGNLYGDTVFGGGFNDGTVYKLNTKGVVIVLHSFTRSDGTSPLGGVIRDAKGNLYGTTWLGGSSGAGCGGYGCGTVWELTP